MTTLPPTAALLIIGNEILSGRTQDKNLNYLALELGKIGVRFKEARVVLDIPADIIDAVNALRKRYDYVFTTGGIGPTHDDITTETIAKAFGVEVVTHPDALQKMIQYYKGEEYLNEGRRKMAKVPQGASLIDNPISVAPGFTIGNVYVMAGIPNVMKAMFDSIKHSLRQGPVVLSKEETFYISESKLAPGLTEIQDRYGETVEVGSYPFVKDATLGVCIVLRSADSKALEAAHHDVQQLKETLKV